MEINHILRHLEKFQLQDTRYGQIGDLIGQFEDKNSIQQARNKVIVNEAILDFKRFGKEEVVGKISKEKLQNVLVAYLFSANRQVYLQEGGQNYDYEKESRQIKAVVQALEGKHTHMGTGEGKSSVVLPIVSIIEALTSDKSSAIVSTASDTLLTDIQPKTEKLISSLEFLDKGFVVELDKFEKQASEEYIDDDLFLTMQKEALLENKYTNNTKTAVTRKYWWHYRFSQKEKLIDYHTEQKPKITFVAERDLVFDMSQDPKKFLEECPRIFMDEADVAFNRKTPYVRTRKDRFITPEEIQNSTYQWLFNFVLAKQLNLEDFESFQGQYLLKEGSLSKLNLKFDENNLFLNQGFDIISKQLGLEENQLILFQKNVLEYFQTNKPDDKDGNFISYVQAVGDILAEMTHRKNRDFLLNEKGVPILRDSYIDELLEEHENQPEYQLAIWALNDRFNFVNLNQAISSAVRFPTFATYAADKLVCFSGTLLYQGLKDTKLKKSSFAKFLEDITKRKAVLVSPPEKKLSPVPEFFKTTQEAEQACIQSFAQHKNPVLLIDYESVDHAQKLSNQIKNQGKGVVLLPPKPSNPQEEKQYNENLTKITRQLAEGTIQVLVSSGTAGIGVNIVGGDGSFPDLSVIHFGIPNHEALISQGNGRRRAPGNSFSWFISQELLQPYLSYFSEEKADKLSVSLGEIDRIKIQEMVNQAMQNPEKRLSVVQEILKQKQRKEAQNTQVMIEYDLEFQKIIKLFQASFTNLVKKELPERDNERIKNIVNLIGVPQSLYYEILQNHPIVPGGGGTHSFIPNLRYEILRSDPSWFDDQLHSWVEANRNKIQDYDQQIFFGSGNLEESLLYIFIDPETIEKSKTYKIVAIRKPNSGIG